MGLRVVVMAGGTGGHIFPALAVAKILQVQGATITWLGSEQGMETDLVPKSGFPIEVLSVKGLRGNGLRGWLVAPFRVSKAIWQAWIVLRRLQPQVVLGLGGFVSGPGGVAAKLLRVPLVIHEQNAVAGMTNRWLAKMATAVFYAFPQAFSDKAQNPKFRLCGNPVRQDIVQTLKPESRFQDRQGALRILVLGGSLGALVLNDVVPAALGELKHSGVEYVVRHQAGVRTLQAAQAAYEQSQVTAEISAFVEDMASAYAWADLVICRAGALTIAELSAVGVAAILVPYAHAVDDHQTGNARYLSDPGAAILIPQTEFSAHKLVSVLSELNRHKLQEMAQRSRALAVVDAAERVAEYCLQVGKS